MNTPIQLGIQRLRPDAILPQYQSTGAACFDLHAVMSNPDYSYGLVNHGTPAVFDTGLAFEVPKDWVMLVFSRSGHGFKSDIRLANCVGVIDSDYRGEVKVKLTNDNTDGQSLKVVHGDRIAQAMLVWAPGVRIMEFGELTDTSRGTAGFGSTGA